LQGCDQICLLIRAPGAAKLYKIVGKEFNESFRFSNLESPQVPRECLCVRTAVHVKFFTNVSSREDRFGWSLSAPTRKVAGADGTELSPKVGPPIGVRLTEESGVAIGELKLDTISRRIEKDQLYERRFWYFRSLEGNVS